VLELEDHVDLGPVRSVNSTACSTVTPGISPTVIGTASSPANTSRCISARNSWMRGPEMNPAEPSP
jgi:hypothetical protein